MMRKTTWAIRYESLDLLDSAISSLLSQTHSILRVFRYESGADLTGSWRLFVDDDELANMSSSVQRKYGQFTKHADNPVMNGSLYGSVLRTADGGFAMYHECATTVCFANSTDGITWAQPTGEVKKQFGTKADVLLTRLGSADKPNQLCTAALGCLPAKTCVPAECRDTQPSVLYTPFEKNATYQMFNFNYGHVTGCKSACPGDGSSTACHACMRDGYYRATSTDGLVFTDDVEHNPVVATHPPHQYGDVSSFVYDYLKKEYYATIKSETATVPTHGDH